MSWKNSDPDGQDGDSRWQDEEPEWRDEVAKSQERVPDSHDGRLMLSVGGLLFIPISVGALWGLFFEMPPPQNLFEWIFRIFLEDLAISAVLFFTIGFLWAISGRRELRRLMDFASVKLAWFLIPLAIPVAVAVVSILVSG